MRRPGRRVSPCAQRSRDPTTRRISDVTSMFPKKHSDSIFIRAIEPDTTSDACPRGPGCRKRLTGSVSSKQESELIAGEMIAPSGESVTRWFVNLAPNSPTSRRVTRPLPCR